MKNITVSVDDATYRHARIRAAELDTSVSALVRDYLRTLTVRQVVLPMSYWYSASESGGMAQAARWSNDGSSYSSGSASNPSETSGGRVCCLASSW